MDNKIQKLEDKIQEQNRLIGVLTRQNKEKDREKLRRVILIMGIE